MENKGLLFIPDISGFTRFVNETEIEHSRYIIQELLEVLINANQTGLEISEIEGDAILFYKFGEPVALEDLYKQVEKMFCAFHSHLNAYECHKICQCKACVSSIDLTLKVITHYGEFTRYNVKNFSKLIGKDIIVAHQLLKNDIPQHEYWLVTRNLTRDSPPADLAQWMTWNSSVKQTETGEIPFHYTHLSPLKNELPPERNPFLEPPQQVKLLSVSREFERDIKTAFYTAVHFEFRPMWQEGVKSVDEVDHLLPGIGTRHRYVMENGEVFMYISAFSYDPESKIIFRETDEKRQYTTSYTWEKTGENKTLFTIDYFQQKNPLSQLTFKLLKKNKMERSLQRSLVNLERLVNGMEVPLEF